MASARRWEVAMLDIDEVIGDLAEALQDQDAYEHSWLLDPKTGTVEYWTRDLGIGDEDPVDLDELVEERGFIVIEPLPSYVWYRDMADFAAQLSDEQAGTRLTRAIRGRGAFRRFKDELYEEYPELVPVWHAFRDVRAKQRAVEWLVDNSLVPKSAAEAYVSTLEEPEVP